MSIVLLHLGESKLYLAGWDLMDALQDAELQLLRLVATLQQKLLVGKDFPAGDCRSSAASVHKVLTNIERLQDKLRDCAHLIAARATEPNENRHENASTVGAGENAGSDTDTEDEEDLPCHQDTAICDQLKSKTSSMETADEGDDNEPGLRPNQQDELKITIAKYAQSAACVAAMDEHANDVVSSFERSSGVAMTAFVRFIKEGGVPSEETAASFRDATVLLPGVVSRLHTQKCWGSSG